MPTLRANSTVTTLLAALVLLLASGAQAQTVRFDDLQVPNKATGIDGLVVSGVGIFNVTFEEKVPASQIYGPFPGDLVSLPPFFGVPNSEAASDAINAALGDTAPPAGSVGEVTGTPGSQLYDIGTLAFICCMIPDDPELPSLFVVSNVNEGGSGFVLDGGTSLAWDLEATTWARFSAVDSVCGNDELEVGEQCDDGNTTPDDGCSATCTIETQPMCGNFILEGSEECDDGNTESGDGCSDMCVWEDQVCGNAVLEDGEECDDGNTEPLDGCSATCTFEQSQDLDVLFDEAQPSKAIGIVSLVVPGAGTFDVTFDTTDAEGAFGPFPASPGEEFQLPPFSSSAEAATATLAAITALNKPQFAAESVGENDGQSGFPTFWVPDIAFVLEEGIGIGPFDSLTAFSGTITGSGFSPDPPSILDWAEDQGRPYAIYTPAPEPSAALLSVAAVGTLILLQRRRRR
jgi:cysteine-rich repeat protein